MSKQVAKVLTLARQRLIDKGWIQKEYCRDGACCAAGAIYAVGRGDKGRDARRALERVVCNDVSLIEWNDTPGRTKQQVLGAFTRAINSELKSQ